MTASRVRSSSAPLQVGRVRLHVLTEIERLAVEPSEFFPDFPVDDHADAWFLDEPFRDRCTGRLVLTIRAYLAVLPGRVVLIDCGVGNAKTRLRPEFDHLDTDWLDDLSSAGVTPEDVDTVVLTHLHVDHVGWATRRERDAWRPTFPNATYLVSERELAFWRSHTGAAAMHRTGDYLVDSVDPLAAAGQLSTEGPATVLPPEIVVEELPGHTPGNRIVRVIDGDAEAVLSGDVLHHPIQCFDPRISSRYCCDSPGAATARRGLLSDVADRRALLLPSHFPGTGVGRVVRAGGTFRWIEQAPVSSSERHD
ncbi:Glyoxylase, beta-lactamase superfamily II [Pseudonocardia ammonioxydans]|uniref:Glyoxylase, beta-lactamase superfamily II n=1 Tax=Pseudonocardia ammonioxydans TaxID=260086 RepID=A0A1I4XFP0_PSUAM|nr:MBL fold metallo-hydrolase [Pseudonocardia ammonioxydans]SFN24714.1 Glyoxylase, beta-lactamase superfamily II [Pseudonocardia ammonioxydans]